MLPHVVIGSRIRAAHLCVTDKSAATVTLILCEGLVIQPAMRAGFRPIVIVHD